MDDRQKDRYSSSYVASDGGGTLEAGGLVNGKLDITGLVRRTFEALGVEAASLASLGMLVYSPLMVFVLILMLRVASGLTDPEFGQALDQIVATLSNGVFVQLASAGAIVLLFARFRGQEVSVGAAIKQALSRVFALIGLAIVVGVAVMLGMLLCIIPGFILQAALAVAVPVLIVEEVGIVDACNRSLDLTRGHRWPIFVIMVFFGLVGGIFALIESMGLAYLFPDPEVFTLVYLPFSLLTTIAFGVINGVATVLIYRDLRLVKEGLDEDDVVAAFE